MKVHLYKKDDMMSFSSAVTECGIIVDVDNIETIDHNAVTCKNCRKTQAFKDLVKTNNETKKAIEEMKVHLLKGKTEHKQITLVDLGCINSIFNTNGYKTTENIEDVTCERCKKSNEYKRLESQATEKLKQEVKQIGVDAMKHSEPKTYKQKIEIEIEIPVGYKYDCSKTVAGILDRPLSNGLIATANIHVEPKVKQGSELVGCLCGISGLGTGSAKSNAEHMVDVREITAFDSECHFYTDTIGDVWDDAYPVPAEKLDELKAKLKS